jgi:hypothetical protein
MYFRPPTSHRARIGQELTVSFLNDIILEDASPLEGMQAMLNSGALKELQPDDEEILVRHLHRVMQEVVAEGERARDWSR